MNTPQNIWCIPTVEDLVLSQCLYGVQVGGIRDYEPHSAYYENTSDIETPLLDPHLKVIY
ncbi:MAG: hypothetical protein JW776_15415 [Candidatus Lokiarchaeota archaeon]|nr:hypothetical protein [Candidatus Lokiarchaeota archaeon]